MKLETVVSPGEIVRINELQCDARILGIYADAKGVSYHCQWFMNGELKTGYLFDENITPKT